MFLKLQMVRMRLCIIFFLLILSREQLFLYFGTSNVTEFSVNLFFYKLNVLKYCLHLDAFISNIQQVLPGVLSRKTNEMKLGIIERVIKYSLSI